MAMPETFFDLEMLTPWAIFGAFTAIAWLLLEQIGVARPRALVRLKHFQRRREVRPLEEAIKKRDRISVLLEKTSPVLAKPLEPKSTEEMTRLRQKLMMAGFRSPLAPTVFLGAKFLCLMIGLLLVGGFILVSTPKGPQGWGTVALIVGGFFYLPDLVVWYRRRHRQEQIFHGLPDALDLMVVCVEAGLGLDQAMRKVAEEMKRTYPVIAEEFGVTNFQLQIGRPRSEVFQELGTRTGVNDLKMLTGVLIQADKFGTSIAHALRTQSEMMRTRRRQLAEEKAAKTAVKLIFPLVLFIFPAIFVVLVGPAAITIIRELFPLMGR